MTNHPGSDQLNAYLDGQMASNDARRIEAHLSSCSQCSVALDSLSAAAEHVRDLPPVEPTPDEHRELRQAILSARPQPRMGWLSSMQWALAGGLAIVLIASIGFLFLASQGPDSATEADLSSAAESSGGPPELSSPAEVEDLVAALPEVASARGEQQTLSRQGADGASGGDGGAAGGSGDYAGATAEAEAESGEGGDSTVIDGPEPLAEEAPAPSRGADERVVSQSPRPATCAGRLAALQADPVALLTQLDVVYRGEPALLAVYAYKPGDRVGGYDRTLALIVASRDCAELSGPELEDAILYRSESRW